MSGDYQTPERMAKKRRAIPLPDLEGKSVLDVGCDHGEWCRIASESGAAHVIGIDRGRKVKGAGFVDLVQRNRAQGWPNCDFEYANLGREWPWFGAFDVVFAFSVYHHVFAECGDHDAIWEWLAKHTAEGGQLIWEGPVDVRDAIARARARGHETPYTRRAILAAAERFFDVEFVGPAIHREYREVWVCRPRRGVLWDRAGAVGDVAGAVARDREPDRLGAGTGDAERADVGGTGEDRGGDGPGPVGDRAGEPERPATDVARPRDGGDDRDGRAASPAHAIADPVPGDHGADTLQALWSEGRAPRQDRALILGGAACVWEDVAALEQMLGHPWDGIVIAANDIGCHWPRRLDHWCSLHPEKLKKWADLRAQNGHPDGYLTWARRLPRLVDRLVHNFDGGASGMLAVRVAQALGCTHVVLCGVPMDRSGHFEESTEHQPGRAFPAAGHWKKWRAQADQLRGWVKSMSMTYDAERKEMVPSPTRALLGEPTLEWFNTERPRAA